MAKPKKDSALPLGVDGGKATDGMQADRDVEEEEEGGEYSENYNPNAAWNVATGEEIEGTQATPMGIDSPLGTWEPEDAKESGWKILVYGTSGSGKTWFGATFPSPLFVDLEGGMRSVAHRKPMRLPKDPKMVIDSVDALNKAGALIRKMLRDGTAPFKTVVVDSLSEMQELVMANVLAQYSANRLYDDQPTQADYGKANRDFIKIFLAFLRLPCHVVFTNVVAPKAYEEDQSAPTFVGKVIGPYVSRRVDAIGYTYTTVPSAGKEDELRYLISFANTPEHVAKDRLGIGNKPRPNNFNAVFKQGA